MTILTDLSKGFDELSHKLFMIKRQAYVIDTFKTHIFLSYQYELASKHR